MTFFLTELNKNTPNKNVEFRSSEKKATESSPFYPKAVKWWKLRENCPLKKHLMANFDLSGPEKYK